MKPISFLRRALRRLTGTETAAQPARGAGGKRPAPRPAQGEPAMVLRGRSYGMFANVNNVAEFAARASAENREFVVAWPKSPYRDPLRRGDPWLYYFEPVFPGARRGPASEMVRDRYRDANLSTDHLFQPRLVDGVRDSLALPTDRARAAAVLERFIRLNQTSRAFVDDFAANYFTGPVIGLHLRGPGRDHGGTLELRAMADPTGGVPYDLYFDAVDAALETHPEALIFACSDSQAVIDRVRARFGARAIVYPASRSDFGEMHENHPENGDQVFSPYKLGLDVVVEAHLLTRCVHFVHGNSNVVNYVLCRAPNMPNTYVYAHLEAQLAAEMRKRKAEEAPAAG